MVKMKTKEKKYYEWAEHPRWRELLALCNELEILKTKSEKLRKLIEEEVFV